MFRLLEVSQAKELDSNPPGTADSPLCSAPIQIWSPFQDPRKISQLRWACDPASARGVIGHRSFHAICETDLRVHQLYSMSVNWVHRSAYDFVMEAENSQLWKEMQKLDDIVIQTNCLQGNLAVRHYLPMDCAPTFQTYQFGKPSGSSSRKSLSVATARRTRSTPSSLPSSEYPHRKQTPEYFGSLYDHMADLSHSLKSASNVDQFLQCIEDAVMSYSPSELRMASEHTVSILAHAQARMWLDFERAGFRQYLTRQLRRAQSSSLDRCFAAAYILVNLRPSQGEDDLLDLLEACVNFIERHYQGQTRLSFGKSIGPLQASPTCATTTSMRFLSCWLSASLLGSNAESESEQNVLRYLCNRLARTEEFAERTDSGRPLFELERWPRLRADYRDSTTPSFHKMHWKSLQLLRGVFRILQKASVFHCISRTELRTTALSRRRSLLLLNAWSGAFYCAYSHALLPIGKDVCNFRIVSFETERSCFPKSLRAGETAHESNVVACHDLSRVTCEVLALFINRLRVIYYDWFPIMADDKEMRQGSGWASNQNFVRSTLSLVSIIYRLARESIRQDRSLDGWQQIYNLACLRTEIHTLLDIQCGAYRRLGGFGAREHVLMDPFWSREDYQDACNEPMDPEQEKELLNIVRQDHKDGMIYELPDATEVTRALAPCMRSAKRKRSRSELDSPSQESSRQESSRRESSRQESSRHESSSQESSSQENSSQEDSSQDSSTDSDS